MTALELTPAEGFAERTGNTDHLDAAVAVGSPAFPSRAVGPSGTAVSPPLHDAVDIDDSGRTRCSETDNPARDPNSQMSGTTSRTTRTTTTTGAPRSAKNEGATVADQGSVA